MRKIPHNRPTLGIREAWAAFSTIRSGWVAQGTQVGAFENELCNFLRLPDGHAVCVSSGTAALALALRVLDVQGKQVAMPAYACSSLRHANAFAGANEVLLDIASYSQNIDTDAINRVRPHTTIIPHMFGIPVDLQKVNKGIHIIEDCAQAIGARCSGQSVGTIGDAGVFSFYATKLMTTGGQGGAVVSKDKTLIDAVRDYREFDCRRDSKVRFNFQLTDTLAAVGRVQLRRLPEFLRRREELFEVYKGNGLQLLGNKLNSNEVQPVRFRAVYKTNQPSNVVRKLSNFGIKAIVPIEEWELLGEPDRFPNAKELCRSTVSLPLYPVLSKKEIQFIAQKCGRS